ncbi:DUF7660 family protein [Streptomyces massasporeus]
MLPPFDSPRAEYGQPIGWSRGTGGVTQSLLGRRLAGPVASAGSRDEPLAPQAHQIWRGALGNHGENSRSRGRQPPRGLMGIQKAAPGARSSLRNRLRDRDQPLTPLTGRLRFGVQVGSPGMTTSPDHVDSREDLAAFVRSLRRSHAEDGRPWENADLPSFLDAMAAWMDDADGWYRNTGRELPPGGDWAFFARALQAATTYE